jgi:hypothetical protein
MSDEPTDLPINDVTPPGLEATELGVLDVSWSGGKNTADTGAERAARDAVELYRELAARLDERGVTIEQMQAAVDAGDAERVRKLFGYTHEEMDAVNARAQAVAFAALNAMSTRGNAHTEGLNCERGILECGAPYMLFAWTQPQFGAAILIFGGAMSRCHWESPRRKQP